MADLLSRTTLAPTCAVLVLTALATGGTACASDAHPDLGPLLERSREAWKAPGAILSVRFQDGTVRTWTSGVANVETGRPIRSDDVSYIGSITKLYTATVVLQLVAEEKLGLDDPLSKFFPEFPRASEIRLRHLLNHSSGIDDPYVHLYMQPMEQMLEALETHWTPDRMIDWAARLEPHFEPGGGYFYSNVEYDLLGKVIEKSTGKTLQYNFRDRLYEPLGLESTWLAGVDEPRRQIEVVGYIGQTDYWPNSKMFGELGPSTELDDPVNDWASGALVSTAREMLTFFDALRTDALLPEEMRREMMTFVDKDEGRVLEDPLSRSGSGLGMLSTVRPGFHMVGHGGAYNGYTAQLWHVPASDISVALLVNRGFVFRSVLIVRAIVDELADDARSN